MKDSSRHVVSTQMDESLWERVKERGRIEGRPSYLLLEEVIAKYLLNQDMADALHLIVKTAEVRGVTATQLMAEMRVSVDRALKLTQPETPPKQTQMVEKPDFPRLVFRPMKGGKLRDGDIEILETIMEFEKAYGPFAFGFTWREIRLAWGTLYRLFRAGYLDLIPHVATEHKRGAGFKLNDLGRIAVESARTLTTDQLHEGDDHLHEGDPQKNEEF